MPLVLAFLFLMAACSRAPQPTATPTLIPEAPRNLPTIAATAIPTAAATRAPLPPAVISIAPDRGEEQLLAAPITITFDQTMDPASTSAAFSIEPKVAGEVQVRDNRLIFSPTERLKRGAEYRVNLAASARSSTGLPLVQPVSFKFKTAGFLQVTDVQPADGTAGVPVDATLTVAFNRPVVALGGPTASALQPLIITPTVSGAGEWITTSIYRFTPTAGLAASTDYTVTV
ncbi:MAG: Ig-like domain-containing protein, partial [Anaerolineae bacterium]